MSMRISIYTVVVTSSLLCLLTRETHGKLASMKLTTLIEESDVIAIASPVKIEIVDDDVVAGRATLSVKEVLKGEVGVDTIDLVWETRVYTQPISSLEWRLLFLQNDGSQGFRPTRYERSVWPLVAPYPSKEEKCHWYVVYAFPVDTVVPENPEIIRKTKIIIPELSYKQNPVEVDAICIDDIRSLVTR